MRPMLVQPDELGSTGEEHDGAAALKTDSKHQPLQAEKSHGHMEFYVPISFSKFV